nr:MAG TPA: minor structural protein [Caudoviricetes sp.]
MALERKTLREILEDETTDTSGKLKKILDVLHKETDTLQNQLDEKDAALAKAEKDRDAANGGKQAAEKALTDYKAQQTQKDTHAAKEAKFRELLKTAGVLDKYADRVVRLSGEDIDKLELDEKGEVKDAKKHADSLKADWSDFVGTTTTTGAKVDTPPTNTGSKMTKEQIINIKDASERQAAIAANPEAFGLAAKE